MKNRMITMAALVLAFVMLAAPAAAYIERGTVGISAETEEVTIIEGESAKIAITLDPAEEDQMPGCGMADCPQECGQNCLSKDGNCTCDITEYETYYTEVQLKMADEAVAKASYSDGVLTVEALTVGETSVNVAARLREYMGSSVDIKIIVMKKPVSAVVWIAAAAAVIAVIAVVLFLIRKGRKK